MFLFFVLGSVRIKQQGEKIEQVDIDKMVKLLQDHTSYKVVTDDKYQMLRKHSSPKARVNVEFDQGPSRPPPRQN